MFNTMTLVKIIGGFGGALLAYLLIYMISGALYATGGGEGEEQVQAYVVETDDGGSAAGEEQTAQEAEPDFAAILAEADAEKGAKVFGKCKACHKLEKALMQLAPTCSVLSGARWQLQMASSIRKHSSHWVEIGNRNG